MAEQSEIYLYLPSSVKSFTVENTVSKYLTHLSTPIRMQEGLEYEIALLKLIYPSNAQNIHDGTYRYYSYIHSRIIPSRIPAGQYKIPDDLVVAFEKSLGKDAQYYEFSADKISQKFLVKCGTDSYMELSENLQAVTGLPETISKAGITVGSNSYDENGGMQNMYIYTDLVQLTNIGDTLGPVLSVVNYKGHSGILHHLTYEPSTPVYVPLSKTYLDSITVELKTKTGRQFPFTSGEILVLIHVRQKEPRL
ncbi:MAG: hypothetical protein GY804_04310 [Alphaproteobacteria bacterium]|nr:hypothetical protein [Alphaproteobacteria bacterium]